MDLVPQGDPCLFGVLDVVWRPMGEQGMECSDVVDDDLVPWISVLLAVLVIDDEPPLV